MCYSIKQHGETMTDERMKKLICALLRSKFDAESIMTMCGICKIDKTMDKEQKNLIDNTIHSENGQKLSVGQLVRHRTVPQLGLGIVAAEHREYKGYWVIKWCDARYHDVGQLGIQAEYLEVL